MVQVRDYDVQLITLRVSLVRETAIGIHDFAFANIERTWEVLSDEFTRSSFDRRTTVPVMIELSASIL